MGEEVIHKNAANIAWEIVKEQPCRLCGAMSSDGPEACRAGQDPLTCDRRKAASRHETKRERRRVKDEEGDPAGQ